MDGRLFEVGSGGLACALSASGASVTRVGIRDKSGRFIEAALSPENFAAGMPDPSLAGRTIGPCCGRVRNGRITIDGEPVQLARNEGANHLHGGPGGCAFRVWQGERLSPDHVRFSLELTHGTDGYPGNRRIQADYTVSGDALSVVYTAETDRPTWLDLTSHVYWDLGGRFDGSALDQRLTIAANAVVFNGEGHLPERVVPVSGAFDFTGAAPISEAMRREPSHPQLALGRGYNNAFILDRQHARRAGGAAALFSPASGIRMTMETDAPAIVLYSGGFLDADTRIGGRGATPGCAVALEAQSVPDPFHLPGQRPAPLYPGRRFQRRIVWHFDRL